MKRLHSPQDAAQWLRTQVRGVLHTDSRRVGAGDGFIAWPGETQTKIYDFQGGLI